MHCLLAACPAFMRTKVVDQDPVGSDFISSDRTFSRLDPGYFILFGSVSGIAGDRDMHCLLAACSAFMILSVRI